MSSNLVQLPVQRQTKRDRLFFAKGPSCHWCGIETRLSYGSEHAKATIDHILPRYKGGDNQPSNLVLACNLCNNRRNYEDHAGLPEGYLLGVPKSGWLDMKQKYVCLTGDEKKSLLAGRPIPVLPKRVKTDALDVLRAQRDQAQKEIAHLRSELKHYMAAVATLEEERKNLTVMRLMRRRIAEWLLRK